MTMSLSFLNALFGVSLIFWIAILLFAIRAKIYSGEGAQQFSWKSTQNSTELAAAPSTQMVTRKTFVWANWQPVANYNSADSKRVYSVVTLSLFVMSFMLVSSAFLPAILDTIVPL